MNTQRCDLGDIHVFVKCLREDIRDLVRISVLRVAKSRLYVGVAARLPEKHHRTHSRNVFVQIKIVFH